MKRPIQPYESHMQYVPQWMCDHNLYGCAYLDVRKFLFRSPVPEYQDLKASAHIWHDNSIDPELILEEGEFPRQSHCPLEIDISIEDITNRLEIEERRIHHDFTEQSEPFSNDQKLVHSMAGLWRDETRRRKARMGLKDSDASPFPPEVLLSVSADPRNTSPGGWIHEEEYRGRLEEEIVHERGDNLSGDASFRDLVKSNDHYASVKTAFESIARLFPSNFQAASPPIMGEKQVKTATDLSARDVEQDVDEERIFALQDEKSFDSDDEEAGEEAETEEVEKAKDTESSQTKKVNDVIAGDRAPLAEGKEELVKDLANINNYSSKDDAKPIDGSKKHYSYSELENLGIVDAGCFIETEVDAFTVGYEYRSNLPTATSRARAMENLDELSIGPRKRQKLDHIHGYPTTDSLNSSLRTGDCEHLDVHAPSSCESRNGFHENSAPKVVLEAREEGGATQPISQEPIAQPPRRINELTDGHQQSDAERKQRNDLRTEEVLAESRIDHASHRNTDSTAPLSASITYATPDAATHLTRLPILTRRLLSRLDGSFIMQNRNRTFLYALKAPSRRGLTQSFRQRHIPSINYQDAYYGEESDVPDIEREYAGKGFRLESVTVPYLPEFSTRKVYASLLPRNTRPVYPASIRESYTDTQKNCEIRNWEIKSNPPKRRDVIHWERSVADTAPGEVLPVGKSRSRSQIDAATQKNKHGFKYSQKQADTSVRHETQYMSLMSLEVHVNTRRNLVPDPEKDEVSCIFWCFQSDNSNSSPSWQDKGTQCGVVALSGQDVPDRKPSTYADVSVEVEETELDLINRMVDIVRDYDPDILTGFEVHNSSWGYIIERARRQYDYDLCEQFSRTKAQSHGRMGRTVDPWGFNQTSTIRITGRHMINIWRAMRGELNLLQYTLENIVFHVLHRRIPHYSHKDLTRWWTSTVPRNVTRVLDYHLTRARLDIDILEQNELIARTSEQARLLGVDFFSVFSRGSQFKVESLMFRIAKPENFILISPSRKQVGQQNALECLPLVMEPQSAFYPSPLLVLDFQSLYPSVMIAYNYCYSTFLGRIVSWRGQNKMGFTDFERQDRMLELLKTHINIAPNGMMYARPEIRKSLLAKMLGEILETRVMVKSGMKVDKNDKTLQRLLNNRQLALKLIANVTYGYTSASFSGRMPCSEIADSIVQTGRETLEKAIALIHSVKRWNAEVVYGDTDSLFVYLKGRTRAEAFDVGDEIARAVTSMNPRPVKLKFEKVYHPCVLLAKKRYVGFKFESRAQKKPDFDAKGIETVRRDGTPAEQKIEEKALKLLFRTADLSSIKTYFQNQCNKIMRGEVSIQDFCFAREVKLGTYSDKGPPPPGALISTRRMLQDPRAEPQYGERVPYVVVAGAPGARLIDRCVAPDVLLQDDQQELDSEYYIMKNIIPPLERIFNLVGANVRQWYEEMPKQHRMKKTEASLAEEEKQPILTRKTLASYLKHSACIVCRQKLDENESPLCVECLGQPEISLFLLRQRLGIDRRRASSLHEVCRSCARVSFGEEAPCDSKDCPVFYTRTRHKATLSGAQGIIQPALRALEGKEGGDHAW